MTQTLSEQETQNIRDCVHEHDHVIEKAWIEEVLRRQQAVRNQTMRTYTLEEVLGRGL